MMVITVMIPTYRRVRDLDRCLQALKVQERQADEILVVVRNTDEETQLYLQEADVTPSRLTRVIVDVPGQVAALNAGAKASSGEVLAITDDDTAPRADWLRRIEEHFLADPRLGGLGGRDWVHQSGRTETGSRQVVGKIQWFGRVIGNHHLGAGSAREVDLLKGANMTYRRSAIRQLQFDSLLKGSGAQVYNDMDFSMAVKKAGWRLVYDPQVAIDHYPAQRFDEDLRNSFNPLAGSNAVHNETYVLLKHLAAWQRLIFLLWAVCIGSSSSPGWLQWVRLVLKEGTLANRKWRAAAQGRRDGWRTWRAYCKRGDGAGTKSRTGEVSL
ncbi:glycosyltransferase [Paenibacillus sp. GD4]|jgi:GT2 family glycosyltransferase|uniref:glycosyltransferase family 2 protein n=1 Tax=Paenibacillus sp. GD4 TaxID=3068890 RepID=UPI0027969156|nr:glycosyltransferase [Paenibacillus sp. GD4]MDQ1910405.1 glycosyltransferase [Paenibacillus sp. GD4]